MIGVVDDREKVIKLWNGLRSSIQRALWRDGYNPEISEWDDVMFTRIMEILETRRTQEIEILVLLITSREEVPKRRLDKEMIISPEGPAGPSPNSRITFNMKVRLPD